MDTEIPVMFVLAVLSVAMWTIRVAVAARGRRGLCALVAASEAVVFALTFSRLVAVMSSPTHVAGYAAGVAVGTGVGLLVTDRLSRSSTELHVVVPGYHDDIVQVMLAHGFPATSTLGQGANGPVTAVWSTMPSTSVAAAIEAVAASWPELFWSARRVERTATTLGSRDGRATLAGRPSPSALPVSELVHRAPMDCR